MIAAIVSTLGAIAAAVSAACWIKAASDVQRGAVRSLPRAGLHPAGRQALVCDLLPGHHATLGLFDRRDDFAKLDIAECSGAREQLELLDRLFPRVTSARGPGHCFVDWLPPAPPGKPPPGSRGRKPVPSENHITT